MNRRSLIIGAAIASLLTFGASGTVLAGKAGMEKCAGIAKAGKNDCGSATMSCAGTSKADQEAGAWIYVPEGTCEKIAGGTLVK